MIEVSHLTKQFGHGKNTVTAVSNTSFSIKKGEIFTLLGTNGAGKTTLLRMLATLLKPSSGTARIGGFDLIDSPGDVRRQIGFLTGDTKLYDQFTPREHFLFFGRLFGIPSDEINKRIIQIERILHLKEFLDRRIIKLSEGTRQKVSIGRAIIHDPVFLILDEPLTGLDIYAKKNVMDFITRSKQDEKAVIFSTHVMSEAEDLSDKLAFMHKGVIVEADDIQKIKEKYREAKLDKLFSKVIGYEEDHLPI